MIRADFHLLDSYHWIAEPPLESPITALGGARDDRMTPVELHEWRPHTAGAFSARVFDGDHFFINGCRESVVQHVAGVIKLAVLEQPRPAEDRRVLG